MNVKIRNKFIEIKYSVFNGLVIFITNYCFQVVRDSDFVSAQYLENELMECIRMENGI